MHIVIFGLSISSAWGNGHATLWRGLLKAMTKRGHSVSFYEKDVPYYASTRDGRPCPSGARICIYNSFENIQAAAERELNTADLALSTSYCPDGPAASQLILRQYVDVGTLHDYRSAIHLLEEGMREKDQSETSQSEKNATNEFTATTHG